MISTRLLRTTAAGLGLALVIPTALLAPSAVATTGPMNYDCTITSPITKTTPAVVTYDTNLPERMYIGDADFVADLDGKGSIDKDTVNLARGFPYNARSVEGRSNIAMAWNGGTVQINTVGNRVPLVADQPADLSKYYERAMTVPTPATVGEYQLVMPTNYSSVNALYKDDGSQAAAPVASCVHKGGNRIVDTVQVWTKATTVLSGPSSLRPGTGGQYTATVTVPGVTGFTGTVSFTKDGTEFANVPVTNGKAVAQLPGQAVGDYTIGATLVSTTDRVEVQPVAPVSLGVGMVATTTTLDLRPNRIIEGESSVARVRVNTADGPADGTVKVQVNGQEVTGTLVSGTADVPLPAVPVGAHDVTATYVPADPATYGVSSAGPATLTVRAPAVATTTALTLDKNQVQAGEPVKGTVTVTAATGTATGTARITIGARVVTGPLVDGAAQLTLPNLPAGNHEVNASYLPADPEAFAPSSAATPAALVVTAPTNTATTTTAVTLTPAQVNAGSPAVVRVFVDSAGGLADGTAEIQVGDQVVFADVVNGMGEKALTGLAPGSYPVQATFVPSGAGFSGSESTVRQLVVTARPSTSTVTVLDPEVTAGQQVRVRVDVAGGALVPAGTVEVSLGDERATGTLVGGTVQVSLPAGAVGDAQVGATFTPVAGGFFAGSTATPATVRVLPQAAATSTELSPATASVERGRSVQVVAQVTGVADPRGVVRFGTAEGSTDVPVVAGRAAFSYQGTVVGSHEVQAEFVPANPRVASASTAEPVTVTVTEPEPAVEFPGSVASTVEVSAPAKVSAGSTFAVSARVSVAGGAAADGRVTFSSGWSVVTVPVSGGVAQARLQALTQGSQAVRAEFVPTGTTVAGSLGTTQVAVTARSSKTVVKAKVKKKTRTLNLRAVTTPSTGACAGTVTFTLTRVQGNKRVGRTVTTALRCGAATKTVVKLPKKKGQYKVTAAYNGSAAVAASVGSTVFTR